MAEFDDIHPLEDDSLVERIGLALAHGAGLEDVAFEDVGVNWTVPLDGTFTLTAVGRREAPPDIRRDRVARVSTTPAQRRCMVPFRAGSTPSRSEPALRHSDGQGRQQGAHHSSTEETDRIHRTVNPRGVKCGRVPTYTVQGGTGPR